MVEREQDRESIALPYCGCESVFCGTDDDRNRRYLVGIFPLKQPEDIHNKTRTRTPKIAFERSLEAIGC